MSEPGKPDDASFLARWSRRKSAAAAPDAVESASTPLPNPSTGAAPSPKMPETPHPEPTLPVSPSEKPPLPPIESLTHEADFSPFMAKDVDAGLRNQAMKKLFADPHYQFAQMDKLDIYIDDYSQPDPLPLEMLRTMNQAKSLFLFDEETNAATPAPTVTETVAGISPDAVPEGGQNAPETRVDLAPLGGIDAHEKTDGRPSTRK